MIHAYDKNYLSKAQTNLATMFDFAVYDLKEDITDFFQKFLQSKISSQFERGEASVLVGKSGVELAIEIFDVGQYHGKCSQAIPQVVECKEAL